MYKCSIIKCGKPLDKSKYTIDFETKFFFCEEDNLVLDFPDGWTLTTGSRCTFLTGADCTFKTGEDCVFKTCYNCKFKTGGHCTFNTADNCTFMTGYGCTFNTGASCIFNTGYYCTFKTDRDCTFDTGEDCTFLVYNINTYIFKQYDGFSIVLDRKDSQRYVLNKDLKKMLKLIKGQM